MRLRYADLAVRNAARVIVLRHDEKVLLFEYLHTDSGDALKGKGSYFVVPGGGKNPNETFYECAKRELYEETGITKEFSTEVIAKRWAPLLKPNGDIVCATEQYFLLRVNDTSINYDMFTNKEKKTIQKHHWLTLNEIEKIPNLWPSNLPEILKSVLKNENLPVIYRSKREQIGDLIITMD